MRILLTFFSSSLYCLKCIRFSQFILRKIIKIVATRCQILRLKCTEFDLVGAPPPYLTGGAYRGGGRVALWLLGIDPSLLYLLIRLV